MFLFGAGLCWHRPGTGTGVRRDVTVRCRRETGNPLPMFLLKLLRYANMLCGQVDRLKGMWAVGFGRTGNVVCRAADTTANMIFTKKFAGKIVARSASSFHRSAFLQHGHTTTGPCRCKGCGVHLPLVHRGKLVGVLLVEPWRDGNRNEQASGTSLTNFGYATVAPGDSP